MKRVIGQDRVPADSYLWKCLKPCLSIWGEVHYTAKCELIALPSHAIAQTGVRHSGPRARHEHVCMNTASAKIFQPLISSY